MSPFTTASCFLSIFILSVYCSLFSFQESALLPCFEFSHCPPTHLVLDLFLITQLSFPHSRGFSSLLFKYSAQEMNVYLRINVFSFSLWVFIFVFIFCHRTSHWFVICSIKNVKAPVRIMSELQRFQTVSLSPPSNLTLYLTCLWFCEFPRQTAILKALSIKSALLVALMVFHRPCIFQCKFHSEWVLLLHVNCPGAVYVVNKEIIWHVFASIFLNRLCYLTHKLAVTILVVFFQMHLNCDWIIFFIYLPPQRRIASDKDTIST